MQSGFLNPGLVQRLIEDVRFGIVFIEYLYSLVAIPIDGLGVAHSNDAIKIHVFFLLLSASGRDGKPFLPHRLPERQYHLR